MRFPLIVSEGRVKLIAVIECDSLRIRRQLMEFYLDTGSNESYMGEKDIRRLQVPVCGKRAVGLVDFAGSR